MDRTDWISEGNVTRRDKTGAKHLVLWYLLRKIEIDFKYIYCH